MNPAPDSLYQIVRQQHRRLRRKIDLRLMPLFCWLYLLNYLDRSNIGNAKILNSETGDTFLESTNMTAMDFSMTITIFSITYTIFEVPSNWVLKRHVRPSLWLATLLFCWGVLTLAFAFLKNYGSVVAVRTLIGVFEAGFYPGIIYVITFWYRQEERAVRIALVSASSTFAGAFGGCIAYGVANLNGRHGLKGWEWLFVIEGSITIACTLLVIFFSPDYPSTAKFLTEDEREFAIQRLAEQQSGYTEESSSKDELTQTFLGPRMLLHYITYLTNVIVFQGLVYFCPTIVNGLGYSSIQTQLMTVAPWGASYVVAIILAKSADHFNSRGYHSAGAAVVSGAAFLGSALLPADAYKSRYACLIVACCGVFPSCSPLTAWVSCNAPSARTVGYAVALNNSVSGIASIIGVWIWRSSETEGGFPTGNKVSAICSFVTAFLALGLRFYYGRMNAKNAANGGTGRVWAL
ncbi:major facilitator superfamily domain-containing protein [Aspergillus heterothallicus]